MLSECAIHCVLQVQVQVSMSCLDSLRLTQNARGERSSQLAVASHDTMVVRLEQSCAGKVINVRTAYRSKRSEAHR
jgi:hypothetical protein